MHLGVTGEGAGEDLLALALHIRAEEPFLDTARPAQSRVGTWPHWIRGDEPRPVSSWHSGLAPSLLNQTSPKL